MGDCDGDENDDGSSVVVAVVMVVVMVIIAITKYITGRGHSMPMSTKSLNSSLNPKMKRSSLGREAADKVDR